MKKLGMASKESHTPQVEPYKIIASSIMPSAKTNEGNNVGHLVMTDATIIMWHGVEYRPSRCLAPTGFKRKRKSFKG